VHDFASGKGVVAKSEKTMKNTQKHEKPPEWDPEYELAVMRLASELGYKPRTIHTLIWLGIIEKPAK